MTKRTNTDLARVRAKSAELRQISAVALIQPPIVAMLSTAERIIARELDLIDRMQARGEAMTLGEAKKLQALMTSLHNAQTIDRERVRANVGTMSDEQLAAELAAETNKGTV